MTLKIVFMECTSVPVHMYRTYVCMYCMHIYACYKINTDKTYNSENSNESVKP